MDAPLLLDLFDPAFRADPYPSYRNLRETAPLWRSPFGQWVVSSHADVTALLRDPRLGHKMPDGTAGAMSFDQSYANEPIARALFQSMLLSDPPVHPRLRGLVSKAFTARRMEALRPRIAAIADELIDAVIERLNDGGEIDVLADFAHKLPVTVICDMLGIPASDRARFLDETSVRGRILDPVPLTRAELDEANADFAGLESYFSDLFAYRRAHPEDDLTSALLTAHEADDKLSDAELVANIFLLFGAGHETTANLITNSVLTLARNPAEQARLIADPALLPTAVEELLRYDSPVQLTGRTVQQPIELHGQTLQLGEEIITVLGAANRDPAAYVGDPEILDIARPGVRVVSFGGGIHHCLGAQLARIEGEISLGRLHARLPKLNVINPHTPEWKPTITLRGVVSLPARLGA